MIPVTPEKHPVFNPETGLIPAIVQDADSGAVLMMAWMNEESLRLTRESGKATFWSRSRQEIWEKGSESGNTLCVREIRVDCDGDTLLLKVDPAGPACHTGTDTCWGEVNDPSHGFLYALEAIVTDRMELADRLESVDDASYTHRLLEAGAKAIAQKVGEEGVEVALEGAVGDDGRLIEESADLLYHLVVLLRFRGKGLADVERVLLDRHRA